MKARVVNQHAIDRYMQWTGCKRVMRSINKILEVADVGIAIGKNRFYANGWVVVVVGYTVKTIYRPKRQSVFGEIYEALKQKHEYKHR